MRIIKRKKLNRKKIVLAVISWIVFVLYIIFFPPENLLSFLIFYSLLALALFAAFKIFSSFLRGVVWSVIIIIYLFLRQYHLDNIINTILLLGIFITLEIYLRR